MNARPDLGDDRKILTAGQKAFRQIVREVGAVGERLDQSFVAAVRLMAGCEGRVLVTGLGKSGIIARKLAATFTSTGTPSNFIHPVEAIHGDLGIVGRRDILVAISRSGENPEVTQLIAIARHFGMSLIALTAQAGSTLARNSDIVLLCDVAAEACPLGLTPTTSTTASLVMGDALAIALIEVRGFAREDFAAFHPGGVLGRSLLMTVAELMHTGDELPVVSEDATLRRAITEIVDKRLGLTCVVGGRGRLTGVCVDGDVKRILMADDMPLDRLMKDVMSNNPETIGAEELVVTALRRMEHRAQGPITVLVVVDDQQKPVGILHIHDILRAGILS